MNEKGHQRSLMLSYLNAGISETLNSLGFRALPRKGILVWFLVLVSVWGMLVASTKEWAINVHIMPHNAFLDFLHYILDPVLLYGLSAWFACYLIVAARGKRLTTKPSSREHSPVNLSAGGVVILSSLFLFLTISGVLCGTERLLKMVIQRARPITRLEHLIITEYLSEPIAARTRDFQMLKGEEASRIFLCPVGKLVFSQPPEKWPEALNTTYSLLEKQLPTTLTSVPYRMNEIQAADRARDHLGLLRKRIGLSGSNSDMPQALSIYLQVRERQQHLRPSFLTSFFENRAEWCDAEDAAPSGHILRQGFVLFLALVIAVYYSRTLPVFNRYPRLRGVYVGVNVALLAWCAWSRLYSYSHTLSDELLSLAITMGLILIGHAIALWVETHTMGLLGDAPLMRAARVMLIYIDQGGRVLAWNEECERLTGWTAQEVRTLDDYITRLYPETNRENKMRDLRRALDEGIEDTNVVTEVTTKDERKTLILWNSRPVRDVSGLIIGKLSVGIEFSRVEKRMADVGLATSVLLHDIRKEMGTIVTLISSATGAHTNRTNPIYQDIERIARRVSTISEEFREYAREGSTPRDPVDLQDVVSAACKTIRIEASILGITIRQQSAPGDMRVLGNARILEQTVVSLLRNSITSITRRIERDPEFVYSGELPEVEVTLHINQEEQCHDVIIEVADNGIGLSEMLQERIRGTFPPGISVRRQQQEGASRFASLKVMGTTQTLALDTEDDLQLGLGLTLAQLVVKDYGGRLDCHNRPVAGAVVILRLPAFSQSPASP